MLNDIQITSDYMSRWVVLKRRLGAVTSQRVLKVLFYVNILQCFFVVKNFTANAANVLLTCAFNLTETNVLLTCAFSLTETNVLLTCAFSLTETNVVYNLNIKNEEVYSLFIIILLLCIRPCVYFKGLKYI